MPKKHIIALATVPASAAVAATPSLPARFLEILVALPMFAWVENSKGEILAHNLGLTGGDQKLSQRPFAFRVARASRVPAWASRPSPKAGVRRDAERGTRDARATRTAAALSPASWKTTAYPLPPVEGCPRRLRLVTLASDAHENDSHACVISTLLALLLGTPCPDIRLLTPQQRVIYQELARGLSYKETAANLGISHDALLAHITRMRKRLGDGIIPRRRRQPLAKEHR